MNQLIQKIASIPEVFSEQIKSANAKKMAMQLYKDGRLTELEFETIFKGFEKTVITVHGVTVDNSTHIDNSIHIDGNVSQSAVGQGGMDHKLKESEIFWNRSRK
jgi:hypothetical protein